MTRHADAMDAAAYWRGFTVNFYFDAKGDQVEGRVLELMNVKRDDPPAIKLQTRDGRVYIVTGRQARLRSELVKAAPAVGDIVTIVYEGEADKAAPGMNKAKEFTVRVKRQGSQPSGRPVGTSGTTENVPGAGK